MKKYFKILSCIFIILICKINFCLYINAQIPTNGLLACYPFPGNANDMTGHGYHGTLINNPVLTTDRFGRANNAYSFNGSSNYISIPFDPFYLQCYSYSVWAFANGYPSVGNVGVIIGFGSYGGDQTISNGNVYDAGGFIGWGFGNYHTTGAYGWAQGYLPPLNTWYHLVLTRDDVSVNYYINGQLVYTHSTVGTTPYYGSGTRLATIGRREQLQLNQYFNGKIDDVLIYNRALTAAEVNQIFNAGINTVTITADPGTTLCTNESVTFTAVINGNMVNPTYQWQVNGSPVGTNSPTYTTNTLNNGDVVRCLVIPAEVCEVPVYSNSLTMIISGNLTLSVSISASPGNNICRGDNVIFTAIPVNGGSVINYQWKINGSNVGGNQPTLSVDTLSNGASVWCIINSTRPCLINTTATSNTIQMLVEETLFQNVSITASPGNNICEGDNVVFTAVPVNAGNNPVYQWKINGINVGNNQPTLSVDTLSDGSVVNCLLTSTGRCLTNNPALSNSIVMLVGNGLPLSVSITADPGNIICKEGGSAEVSFYAVGQNGGNSASYQWKINGLDAGTNSPVLVVDSLTLDARVCCIYSSEINCISNNPATSNIIYVVVLESPLVDAGNSVKVVPPEGTFLNPVFSGGTPPYQFLWTPGNVLSDPKIAGPYATPARTTTFTLLLTDAFGCTSEDTVTIYVDETEDEIFIPNTFSPNGDNQNDILYVRGYGIVKMEFSVFDRWGEKVFTTEAQETGWDGTYKGKKVNPGVFAYYLLAKMADNRIIEKKGNVSLIR